MGKLIFIEILELSKDCRKWNSGVFMHVNNPEGKKQDYKECLVSDNLLKMCSCRTSQNCGVVVLRIYFIYLFTSALCKSIRFCRYKKWLLPFLFPLEAFSTPHTQLLILSVILKKPGKHQIVLVCGELKIQGHGGNQPPWKKVFIFHSN